MARAAVVVTSLLVVTIGFITARDMRRHWKQWTSDRLVSRAEGYFDEGDYPSGFARVNKAYQIWPQSERAIRCLAQRCGEVGAVESLYFFDRLERMEKLTADDAVGKLAALIKRHQLKEAHVLALKLHQEGRAGDGLLELCCVLDHAGFIMPSTLDREVCDRLSNEVPSRQGLKLAGLSMKSDSAGQRAAAERCLWRLAESHDPFVARKAAHTLHETLSAGDARSNYLAWLMTEQPGADAEHQLGAFARLTGAADVDASFQDIITQWSGRPVEERLLLGRLIFKRGKPQWLRGLFSREEAVRNPFVAELCIAGHMNVEDLAGSMALLKDRDLLISRAQRCFAEAALTVRTRADVDVTRKKLLLALDAASAEANPNLLKGVAELARERGLVSLAAQAYTACLSIHGAEAGALNELIALYEAAGDTLNTLKTVKRALALWPENRNYQEKQIYVCLLLGDDLERCFDSAAKLQAERPADDMRRLLLSMAHARMGDSTITGSELRKLCARGRVPARYRAVIGGLLKGAGDSETAAQIVSDVMDEDVRLPEEKAFLDLARL